MAYKLQIKRGLLAVLPIGISGEPLFTTDTNDLYIGNGTSNQRFQKYIASGTSSQFLKGDGSLDSTTYQPLLTNPVTGTGTTNYLPKWTSGSALGNSLVFDNGTNVGINTATLIGKLNIKGAASNWNLFGEASDGSQLYGFYEDAGAGQLQLMDAAGAVQINLQARAGGLNFINGVIGINNPLPIYTLDVIGNIRASNGYIGNGGLSLWGDYTSLSAGAFLTTSGNLIVNSTTDTGERLQVSGTGKISSSDNDYVGLTLLNTNNNASLATSSAIKIGITSTVGTHYGTFKITENTANDNTADFTLLLPFGGVEATKLSILGNGNAAFTSSVTATSFIKSGGTSSQYLMADGSVTTGGGGGSVDELQVSLICQVFG